METIEESVPFNTKQVLREVKGIDDDDDNEVDLGVAETSADYIITQNYNINRQILYS
jgi:hypothetical protein